MSSPLEALRQRNIDLYTSAVACVAAGDPRQVQRFGLSERHIPHLVELTLSEVLGLADSGLELRAYLHMVAGRSTDLALRTALIKHGAPRELVIQLFGVSTRRYTSERLRLGVTGCGGRPSTRVLDTSTEHRIWRLWVLLANPLNPARLRYADHWLLIALEVPHLLRSAWALVQRWAEDADALNAFAGDRARLSLEGQQVAEQALRDKHGIQAFHDFYDRGLVGGPDSSAGDFGRPDRTADLISNRPEQAAERHRPPSAAVLAA